LQSFKLQKLGFWNSKKFLVPQKIFSMNILAK